MKKLFLLGLLFFGVSASPLYSETVKAIFNPLSGKFDYITAVTSTTLPAGSTNYIWNTSTLQSGATFYVSSGTVQNQFSVISPNCSGGFGCIQEQIYMVPRQSSFAPFAYIKANTYGNQGIALIGADQQGQNYSYIKSIPIAAGASRISMGDINNTEVAALYMGSNGGFILSTSTYIDDNYALNFGNRFGNYIGLKSPGSLGRTNIYNLPSSSGTQGLSLITDGHNNFSFGFSSAAVSGTQYSIPVLDGNGSLTESGWAINPSLIGLTNLAFGDNFFVTQHMGLGLGATARYYSNTLGTYAEAGSPDVEYAETYRMDWSTFKPGKYEAWVSSGPEGSRGQWQTQRIPISTGTLQEGTTIYLSTGTILQMTVSTLTFSDTSIQRSARMYRDYWIPAPGTIPSEAFADSIAPIVLTTGTVFDLMTTDFDSATEECRTFNIGVPNDVDVSSNVLLTEYWTSFTQTSGDVVWKWYHNSGKTTGQLIISTTTIQSINIPASTVTSSTGTLVTTNYSIATSSLGWVADSMVDGRVCRSGADTGDTMTGDAKLNAVRIRIKLK